MDITNEELFRAIIDRVHTQGPIISKESYVDLVDEVIDEFMADGLISDDDDTATVRAELISRWPEVQEGELES